MARKVFVSYKFRDYDVKALSGVTPPTWPCHYVSYLKNNILVGQIYKGERQDEDLSAYSEDYIWNHLKDKIWDSSVTVLLISPNMKDAGKWQKSQWIPWEISYSLRLTPRSDRTSQRNSIVAVKLPDKNGNTYYFDKNTTFSILRENIDNGYVYLTDWDFFCKHPDYCFNEADKKRLATPDWKITILL
ncbi:MAG: TIR domain-containing protein [Oscillospiraceae bacterium]|nr:TIR domain-containing protein [Oscillospiraceae bacterium]